MVLKPRGGLILCKKQLASRLDRSVFPGLQGGPHMNAIAAIAITLQKALLPEFKIYAGQMVKNAAVLAGVLSEGGGRLITGGTENHMMVIDTVSRFGDRWGHSRASVGQSRHYHQQANHSGRSESPATSKRNSPRHTRCDYKAITPTIASGTATKCLVWTKP